MGRKRKDRSRPGVVVETRGRRVQVRDDDGERTCFLAGHRAVLGDAVRWVEARGEGGKIVAVEPRRTQLRRLDHRGRTQVLAANLRGLVVVMSVEQPGFRPTLLYRYVTAARREELELLVAAHKADLGTPDDVLPHLHRLAELGITSVRTSSEDGTGLVALREELSARPGLWALVGSSGVGKTSLLGALLPGVDVGPVGEISEFWGTGRHTTTSSRQFDLGDGVFLADSPGIRNFTPAVHDEEELRTHFPLVRGLRCKYRNCLHRPGEEGCAAPEELPEDLLSVYRHLLDQVEAIVRHQRGR